MFINYELIPGNAEKFITTRKIDSFESLAKFTADREKKDTLILRRKNWRYGLTGLMK